MESKSEEIQCPACGRRNLAGSLTCVYCHAPLPTPLFEISTSDITTGYREAWTELERRLWRRIDHETGEPVSPSPAQIPISGYGHGQAWQIFRRQDLKRHPELYILDEILDEDFELSKHFGRSSADYPTIYCETLDEYFDPYLKFLNLSETTKKEIIEELKKKAEQEAAMSGGGGEFGVNWPGLGCFINGWLFAYNRSKNAAAALRDPGIKPYLFATIAHEKHGHGFITEYTVSGQEKKEIQLYRQDIAAKFNIKLADTPEDVLLQEKWAILFHSSVFLEEGWAVWIENYLLRRLQETMPEEIVWSPVKEERGIRMDDVQNLLNRLARSGSRRKAEAAKVCLDALESIFVTAEFDPQNIHQAVNVLEKTESMLIDDFSSTFNRIPRYVIGQLLMDRVERGCGAKNVLYAVAIAANVKYNLKSIANADLARVVAGEPRLNMNSRLALLSCLNLRQKNCLGELLDIAREELNLKIPENLCT